MAASLLNKIVAVRAADGWRWARLVEVEAYRSDDPASHSYGGPRGRNVVMYGPAGVLYVYFTYGMHWCANVVCAPAGRGEAVLLRAAEPLGGLDGMRTVRGARVADRDLCRGPARLTQALGIVGDMNGTTLGRSGGVAVLDDGTPPPDVPARGPRVGISSAADVAWRWWVPGCPYVSAYKRHRRAEAAGAGIVGEA